MRVALVTGAAGGIGRATVARLVADDYAVAAYDVDPAVADLAADRVLAITGDVRDPAALVAAADAAVERFGGLHAVVAGAAVIRGGARLWESPVGELDELLDVDVRGVWHTAAATVPVMLAGPDPSACRFVGVASAAAHRGLFGLSAYVAAKHAVLGLVRGLAADLVGTGITACAVSPGATRTPMLDETASLYGLPDPEELAEHQLIRRVIEPEEMAAAIAFCCSPEGAVLNGRVLEADGGPA
jgi:SDR family mycofactocin-dependent oxidoreductase